jgi:tetratricopeptide (TPR) repeat protein
MRGYKTGIRLAAAALLCLLALLATGCGNQAAAYDKALTIFAEGDYAQAAAAFGKLGDFLQAKTYAAYAQGLTYYGQGGYIAAEPYFEQTRDFMYGDQRYRFCHAYALEAAENFADAAVWYGELLEFEDAPQRAAYCRARVAQDNADYETAIGNYNDAKGYQDAAARLDVLNFQIFDRAVALMNDREYGQALTLFLMLGDNYDAPEYARTCKNYMLDQSYADADAMVKSGDLQGAYDIFVTLAGYRDAAARASDLAAQLGIDVTH